MFGAKRKGKKSKGWERRGGDLPPRWTDGKATLRIPDSNPKRNQSNKSGKTIWTRVRLIADPFRTMSHWFVSKRGKSFPMLCPDWVIEDERWDHTRGCPIHKNGPFVRTHIDNDGDEQEVTVKSNASPRLAFVVIDREAQENGDADWVKICETADILGKIEEEADALGGINPGDPFEGYDCLIRKDTRESGTGIWAVKLRQRTPLTDEEIEAIYGVYRLNLPVADIRKIKREMPKIERQLKDMGGRKRGSTWKVEMTGLDIITMFDVDSELVGDPGPTGRERATTITAGGVEIQPEEIAAPMGYDIPALYFGSTSEEITRALKINGYLDDEDDDERDEREEEDRRNRKKRSSKSSSSKKRRSRHDDDGDDDDEDDFNLDEDDDDEGEDEDDRRSRRRSQRSRGGRGRNRSRRRNDDKDEFVSKRRRHRRTRDEDDEDEKPSRNRRLRKSKRDRSDSEEARPSRRAGKSKLASRLRRRR